MSILVSDFDSVKNQDGSLCAMLRSVLVRLDRRAAGIAKINISENMRTENQKKYICAARYCQPQGCNKRDGKIFKGM